MTWQSLRVPVPGYSTIDGVPVAVVAVRRDSESGQLEVVRGLHPTSEWPGTPPPADAKRHIIPTLSFNPHPRRELNIDGQRYFFSSVANSLRCAECGGDQNGFGFVTSDAPTEEAGEGGEEHTALCVACAEKQAQQT